MRMGKSPRERRFEVIVSALALAVGITAFSVVEAHASDDAKRSGGGLFDSALETLGLKTKIGPTPDFVEATHPDPSTLGFIPTGVAHPKRPYAVKSTAGIAAAKAALDAARDAQLAPQPPVAPVVRKPVKPNRTAAGN